jgi:hypothetical protein
MTYRVMTKYDDGYEGIREFEVLEEAKSYFHNISPADIEYSELQTGESFTEVVARKEGRKRK